MCANEEQRQLAYSVCFGCIHISMRLYNEKPPRRAVRFVIFKICISAQQNQSGHAEDDADDPGGVQGFMVDRYANQDQAECQQDTVDQLTTAHFPAGLVHVDGACLQPDNGQTEHKARPIQMHIFLQQIRVLVQCKIEQGREQGADEVGYAQGGKGIDACRHFLGTDIIKNIGKYNECNRPDHG